MKLKTILLFALGSISATHSIGQSYVSTNGLKYTLIEEATGAWCGWCPDGAQVKEQRT